MAKKLRPRQSLGFRPSWVRNLHIGTTTPSSVLTIAKGAGHPVSDGWERSVRALEERLQRCLRPWSSPTKVLVAPLACFAEKEDIANRHLQCSGLFHDLGRIGPKSRSKRRTLQSTQRVRLSFRLLLLRRPARFHQSRQFLSCRGTHCRTGFGLLGGRLSLPFCPALFHRLRDPPTSRSTHVATWTSSGRDSFRRAAAAKCCCTRSFQSRDGLVKAGALLFEGCHYTSYIHCILSEN